MFNINEDTAKNSYNPNLRVNMSLEKSVKDLCIITVKNTANIWHKRLGHIGDMSLFKLEKALKSLKIESSLIKQHISQNCEIA